MSSDWRKSSYSGASGGCVETRLQGDRVHVRDSKRRAGGFLVVDKEAWNAFVKFAMETPRP